MSKRIKFYKFFYFAAYDEYKQAAERIQIDSFFGTTKGKNVASSSMSVDDLKSALTSTKLSNLQLTDGNGTASAKFSSTAASSMKLPAISN